MSNRLPILAADIRGPANCEVCNEPTTTYQVMPDLSADDFAALKADIDVRGVLVPVEYDQDGNILDGHHRVRACEELGITEWPRLIRKGLSEAEKHLHARQLNLARRHMSLDDRKETWADMRRGGMSFRQIAEADGTVSAPTVMRGVSDVTPDTVTGKDGKTYAPRKHVKTRYIPEEKDEKELLKTAKGIRKKDAATRKEDRTARNEKLAAEAYELTGEKSYRVIYADPPWSYSDRRDDAGLGAYSGATRHYPTMTIEQLCDLPVVGLAQDDAVMFLWVTSPLLFEVAPVIDAWGFKYKASFVWDKVAHNVGHYNSVRHELLLICTRGSCTPDIPKLHDSVVSISRKDHSAKPKHFRELIDAMYPNGSRLELFRRGNAPEGWEVWGNEAHA